MLIHAARVADLMGGAQTLGREIRTIGELRQAVEDGLPVSALDRVVHHVSRDHRSAAELKYRIIPRSTLRRRQRLSPQESQWLERLARMVVLAEEVWEDATLAHEFLTSAQPQLEGERPVDLARSDLGTREVEALMTKIEYALPV
jgi:putative toxin-antitoxin system antitoxin component (TIGR02293 family)